MKYVPVITHFTGGSIKSGALNHIRIEKLIEYTKKRRRRADNKIQPTCNGVDSRHTSQMRGMVEAYDEILLRIKETS